MQAWRKRQPESVVLAPPAAQSTLRDVSAAQAVLEREPRRSPAEIENDRIVAEQAAIARGARVAEQMAAAARQEWEAHREPPPLMDHLRFTLRPGSE